MSQATIAEGLVGNAAGLREATRDVHTATENDSFIIELMSGGLDAWSLARLTGQLRSVYATLEEIVEAHRTDAVLGRLFDRRLDRLAAIDHDLERLAGDAADELRVPLPETVAYVDRLKAIASEAPRVVGHHYVRYLGDLSGGQIIASRMRRHFGLTDDALKFYAFEGLGSKGGFKDTYRRLLNDYFAASGMYDTVVAEARLAYELNGAVFRALGESGADTRI